MWLLKLSHKRQCNLVSWIICPGRSQPWGHFSSSMERPTWRRTKTSNQQSAPICQPWAAILEEDLPASVKPSDDHTRDDILLQTLERPWAWTTQPSCSQIWLTETVRMLIVVLNINFWDNLLHNRQLTNTSTLWNWKLLESRPCFLDSQNSSKALEINNAYICWIVSGPFPLFNIPFRPKRIHW